MKPFASVNPPMTSSGGEKPRTLDWWLIGLSCLGLTLALYHQALHFRFIGDDVWFVRPSAQWLRDAFVPSSTVWHYYPLNQVLLYGLPALTGRYPQVMHALNFVIYSGVGLGLAVLLRQMGANPRASIVAALFFVSRGINYEVVTWISALSYLLVVLLTILTLSWWDSYLSGRGSRYAAWTIGGFAAAMLTIEHALVLLPLYVTFDLMMGREGSMRVPWALPAGRGWEGGGRLLKDSLRYLPFVLVILVVLGMKLTQQRGVLMSSLSGTAMVSPAPVPSGEDVTLRLPAERTWFGFLNKPYRAYRDLLMSANYLFLGSSFSRAAEDNWLTRHPLLSLPLWLAAHLWVIWKGPQLARFLLVWVYIYALPLAVAGVPAARYYYMSTVPAAGLVGIGWAAVLGRLGNKVGARTAGALSVGLLVAAICGEGLFIRARLGEWRLASDLMQQAVGLLQKDLDGRVKEVYFLNFPLRVDGPFWPAQVFDNAAEFLHLMVRPPRPEVEVHPVYDRTFVGPWPTVGGYATRGELRARLGQPRVIAYEFLGRPPWFERLR